MSPQKSKYLFIDIFAVSVYILLTVNIENFLQINAKHHFWYLFLFEIVSCEFNDA